MIILYHNTTHVTELYINGENQPINSKSIVENILQLAKKHSDKILIWCHIGLKQNLNLSEIEQLFHHKRIMLSYHPFLNGYLPDTIGYVEDSPFIKINKKVTFATWQMSSLVGAIHTSVIHSCANPINYKDSFDYFLNSFAKRAMPLGLFCYSEPKLLKGNNIPIDTKQSDNKETFKFVSQHYKKRWVFLLLFNLVVYEHKIPFLSFFSSLFYRKRAFNKFNLDSISLQAFKKNRIEGTLDVIIPTLGRKKYLYDVLKDLATQTYKPTTIIIVEQNPIQGSVSELNYITDENWPFEIKHTFIHQTGACNARNIALQQIESEWVFFADDDIRMDPFFIEKTFKNINQLGAEVVTISCTLTGKNDYDSIFQSPFFGSGCSFVRRSCLKKSLFSLSYEYGFGEDNDFGMQLRNKGYDIFYLPEPNITHLKAPIGGFRSKPILKWSSEKIQPKPSPTIMLYRLLYHTKEQLLGYKTVLFLKYYKSQSIKNPIQYAKHFKKQWNSSTFWANELVKENEV